MDETIRAQVRIIANFFKRLSSGQSLVLDESFSILKNIKEGNKSSRKMMSKQEALEHFNGIKKMEKKLSKEGSVVFKNY